MARRVFKLVLLSAIGVVCGFVLHRCYVHVRGIEVCLRNVDTQPLRDGVVRMGHQLSSIGDLAPSESTCVWVKPKTEGSLDVTFTLPSGMTKAMPLDGYLMPGNSGWITGQVTADGEPVINKDVVYYF